MTQRSASYKKITLLFKRPSGTSRGVLQSKDSWIIRIRNTQNPEVSGTGECSIIQGLSPDDPIAFEEKLDFVCRDITETGGVDITRIKDFPAIRFGLETALLDYQAKEPHVLFPSDFTRGKAEIPINGLVWMGDIPFMKKQLDKKIDAGFTCLKLKIGAIDFEQELKLLQSIRASFSSGDLELRVDANGAFLPGDALEKLKRLAEFGLHSIEQPIKQGQAEKMADLCSRSPIPVALDEELIGVHDLQEKHDMLKVIRPQFIILKPSLLGGLKAAEEWITLSEREQIGWWATSALESNIGLNAIAQWVFGLKNSMPQGLGTGQLYTNNIASPLHVRNGFLGYNPEKTWGEIPL